MHMNLDCTEICTEVRLNQIMFFSFFFFLFLFFFFSVIPLLRESVGILMQRIPTGLEKSVHIAYQRVRLGLAFAFPVLFKTL